LLPLPNHAKVASPSIPTPVYDGHPYDSRNDYNQHWSRELPLPTLQHIAAPYYASRSEGGNRTHESHNYTHREIPQSPVTLPVPTSVLPPRPRMSEMPRRGSISHTEHSMRYTAGPSRHQISDTLSRNMHFAYNPAQESREASLPERQNGNSWEEEQFWPPPRPAVFPAAPEQYGSKGYQGFNNR